MSIHVAILCEYPTLNGGERSILACTDQFREEGTRVTFLAPPRGPLAAALRRRSLPHVPFDLHAGESRLSRGAAIEQLVASFPDSCDLLHANSLAMGRLAGAAAKRLPAPCTAHLRDILKLSPAAIADLNGNARLIAVAHAVRAFHVAQGLDARRTTVVHNGIDVAEFRPHPRRGALREELGLPEGAFLVAAIGQICLRKGQDVFAAAAVRAAAAISNAHFVLIGARHSSKPESLAFDAGIADAFARAGLGHRFHPLGERTDVPTLLNDIDVLVHAARQEPFGRVLLEAAACGVPIVATRVGGTAEMLTDGRHALLVRPDDPQAIADAVARLAGDRQSGLQLGRAARAQVAGRFLIERSAAELMAAWRHVVSADTR